jgi:hypothetical protein
MRKIAFMVVTVFLLAALATAQIPTSGNIFIGYSYENTDWSGLDSSLSRPNLHGWEASLEGKLFPHLGIVTDFAGHYGSQSFTENTPGGPSASTLQAMSGNCCLVHGSRFRSEISRPLPRP